MHQRTGLATWKRLVKTERSTYCTLSEDYSVYIWRKKEIRKDKEKLLKNKDKNQQDTSKELMAWGKNLADKAAK